MELRECVASNGACLKSRHRKADNRYSFLNGNDWLLKFLCCTAHLKVKKGGENKLPSWTSEAIVKGSLILWNAHNGNSCHATSSRNASYFPSFGSCWARLDVSENGTLDQFGVRERASASAFYGRRSAAKSARFQRPSCRTLQTPKIFFGNGTENMSILIKSRAITRPTYSRFAVQCSSFIKWFLTNHKWRHAQTSRPRYQLTNQVIKRPRLQWPLIRDMTNELWRRWSVAWRSLPVKEREKFISFANIRETDDAAC